MNDVAKAKETVARLEADLTKAADRATALQTERRQLSYAALNGDDKAKSKLHKLNTESVTVGFEIENVRAAIDEARLKLAEAESHAALAAQRANAQKVMALADDAAKRGARIRELRDDLCNELQGVIDDQRRFASLGVPVANQRLVELALMRSVLPQLREVGFDVELVPPSQRHQPESVVSDYVQQATRWAANVLGEKVEAV